MKQTNSYEFTKHVCKNENIDLYFQTELRLPTNKKLLKDFTRGCATDCQILVDDKLLPYIPDKSCPATRNRQFDKATKIIKRTIIPISILIKKCDKIKIEILKGYYPHQNIIQYNNEIFFYID